MRKVGKLREKGGLTQLERWVNSVRKV